jgi:hypothetical protein
MFYIEDYNFLSSEQKLYLEESLISEKMSFKLATSAAELNDNGYHFINHILISEDRTKQQRYYEKNLEEVEVFSNILKTFCNKNYIKLNNIFRIAVNITFNNGFVSKCPIHNDHLYDHKQVLLYLNDATGDTVICDDSNKPVIISSPQKYKAIAFSKQPHYHYFPTYGIRCVAVFTFN